jgi:hypothetical protein
MSTRAKKERQKTLKIMKKEKNPITRAANRDYSDVWLTNIIDIRRVVVVLALHHYQAV